MWKNIVNAQDKVGIRCVDDRRDDRGTWARAYNVADRLLNAGLWDGEGTMWVADPHQTFGKLELYGKRPDELVRGVDWDYYNPPPAPVATPPAPPSTVIEAEVFDHTVTAHIGEVVEVNLPEWSGRMNKAYTLSELARLKAFIAQVESALGGSPVPTPTDTAPSARAEVVAEAIAEDETALTEDDYDELDIFNPDDDGSDNEGIDAWYYGEDEDYDFEGWDGADWDDHAWGVQIQPVNCATTRRAHKNWRRLAIRNGARPYVPRYALAPDVVTFEGEVYRIVDVPGWSSQWGAS